VTRPRRLVAKSLANVAHAAVVCSRASAREGDPYHQDVRRARRALLQGPIVSPVDASAARRVDGSFLFFPSAVIAHLFHLAAGTPKSIGPPQTPD